MRARAKRMMVVGKLSILQLLTQLRKRQDMGRRFEKLGLLAAFEKASQEPIDLGRTTVAT